MHYGPDSDHQTRAHNHSQTFETWRTSEPAPFPAIPFVARPSLRPKLPAAIWRFEQASLQSLAVASAIKALHGMARINGEGGKNDIRVSAQDMLQRTQPSS